MNTFKTAALEVLKKAAKPLHISEITRLALEAGLETESADPEATMGAQIIMDIKNKGEGSDFVKTAPATFAVNLGKKEIKQTPKIIEAEKEEEQKIIVESGYTGKGGEHLVCGELLFRGFNASIMSVDVGLDIVAVKDNQLFGIQVKTSNLNRKDYAFNIRKAAFERHNSGNVFYIFVLHSENKNIFLILPLHKIDELINQEAISEVKTQKLYHIRMNIEDDKVYLGEHDLSYHINNWGLIK